MQQVFGIHTYRKADGTTVRRTARFRLGLRDNTLTALGEDAAPGGATLAVTSDMAALRVVSVPLTDPRKAAQVAPFEVEGQVPYDIDKAVVGQETLEVGREGTRLLVAVAPRTHIAALIEAHGGGDAPQVVLPEAYALYAFARGLKLPDGGATLVVDLRPGRLVMVALAGGRWLGGRLRGVAWDPAAPYLPEEVAAALRRAAQSLLVESGQRPVRVVVTGEGPAPGPAAPEPPNPGPPTSETAEAVAKALGLDLVPLESVLAGFAEVAGHDAGAVAVNAVAVGAGLAAMDGRRRLNLRTGPFALVTEGDDFALRRVAGIGLGLLIVLGLVWGDGLVRMHAAEVRLEAAKAGLEAQYRAVFPDAGRVVDPVVQAKNALDALNSRSLLFGGGGITALGVLNAASEAIPQSLTIDVLEFAVEGNRVRIEAEAASFDAIDQIRDQLQARPEFSEVRVSDAKASAKEGRVKFRVALTVKDAI
jgi:type II secretion system protein L